MQVREVMTRDVVVVHPDTTLQEAAERMRQLNVGPLPVCDGDHLMGMITDRDITIRSTAEGLDPWITPVRDAMTPGAIFCFEDQDVCEAAELMKKQQVRRLAVLDRDRRLVGIVSLGDVAVQTGDEVMSVASLEGVSQSGDRH